MEFGQVKGKNLQLYPVSAIDDKGPTIWAIFFQFPRYIVREMDRSGIAEIQIKTHGMLVLQVAA